jgi:F-type H+-transporting ATPase subunit a
MQKFECILSPLDQFEIKDLLSLDTNIVKYLHISLTNIGLYLLIGLLITISYSLLATNNNKIIPNN